MQLWKVLCSGDILWESLANKGIWGHCKRFNSSMDFSISCQSDYSLKESQSYYPKKNVSNLFFWWSLMVLISILYVLTAVWTLWNQSNLNKKSSSGDESGVILWLKHHLLQRCILKYFPNLILSNPISSFSTFISM